MNNSGKENVHKLLSSSKIYTGYDYLTILLFIINFSAYYRIHPRTFRNQQPRWSNQKLTKLKHQEHLL